ncbi:site-specific integrase [Glutamicibacter bergerei]|uniref:Site-specific integrase n=1 Tax=Glutamicibacter bergerei TaxID=256702 RepID=A0ABV9MJZ0_9MICC
MNTQQELVLLSSHGAWNLHGSAAARFSQANDYLGYLSDRNYSSATTRAYGYDLLAFRKFSSQVRPLSLRPASFLHLPA